ncbi:MAG: dihydrofolate reductase [Aeromicrobium sp.]|uniref:dihydrofolate reductase n=1 Tax=Aeromicrobium sp. TaxID=1871063 RepID=UPI0039E5A0D4
MSARGATLVVAMGANRVIGADGGLPWHLPEDLVHFKRLTLGHVLVMGRATYDSIGRPLPGRTTIVVTRDRQWRAGHASVRVAHDVAEAVALGRDLGEEVFIAGGAQIYAAAVEAGLVDRLVVTRVAASPEGDTFFPRIDWSAWTEVASIPGEGELSGERVAFEIVTYEAA